MKHLFTALYLVLVVVPSLGARQSDPLFFKTTLAENVLIHQKAIVDYVKHEGTCLFINVPKDRPEDFEGREWMAQKNAFDRVFACGLPVEDLEALFSCLTTKGRAVLFYFPKESPHFSLLGENAKQEPTSLHASRHRYKKALEDLHTQELNITIYRSLAFYPNKKVLVEEIQTEPRFWGQVSQEQIEALLLSLPEDQEIVIPFKMLKVILSRC